ncbi:MAG TPA: dehydratase [Alphaproteobacteria bacterium]|nr:dehydratase [Alphaproteobacteria bacterium]HAJ47269.1 dehydratase [Alphaproteobacteria bacterium]
MTKRQPKYYFEDFVPGPPESWGDRLITREEVIAFASEYDPQPHHLDDAAAEASVLKGLSASGWHSCAIAMRMACDWFLLDSAALGSPGIAEVRWRKPVRPGDRLTMRRTVNSARPSQSKADRGYVAMLWELINQQGEVVMTLDATTILARREVRP